MWISSYLPFLLYSLLLILAPPCKVCPSSYIFYQTPPRKRKLSRCRCLWTKRALVASQETSYQSLLFVETLLQHTDPLETQRYRSTRQVLICCAAPASAPAAERWIPHSQAASSLSHYLLPVKQRHEHKLSKSINPDEGSYSIPNWTCNMYYCNNALVVHISRWRVCHFCSCGQGSIVVDPIQGNILATTIHNYVFEWHTLYSLHCWQSLWLPLLHDQGVRSQR